MFKVGDVVVAVKLPPPHEYQCKLNKRYVVQSVYKNKPFIQLKNTEGRFDIKYFKKINTKHIAINPWNKPEE